MVYECGHTHLIVFTHVCGYYLSAATISLAKLQVRLLFEGGYYSGCGFYSNKYGMQVFALGHENRSTGATKMNIYSSRSHALLCITVIGVSKSTGSQTIGRLLQYCYYNIHSKISQYTFHIATQSLPIYCKILLVWNKNIMDLFRK